MKKLLALSLVVALVLFTASANANTTIDQMTTGPGSLTGAEELPFLYSGTTTSFKTTSQQIANLAPGSQSLPFVSPSGLTCDGLVIAAGVVTTAGSPTVTLAPSAATSYPITFAGAAAGDTIVISNPAPHDSPHSQMAPNICAKMGWAASIWANRSMSGSRRKSVMFGMSS